MDHYDTFPLAISQPPRYSNDMTKQADYEKRQRERGYRPVRVWVPAADVERLKAYAARLRKQFQKKMKE